MKKLLGFVPTHILGLYVLGVLTQYYLQPIANFFLGISIVVVLSFLAHFLFKKNTLIFVFGIGMLSLFLHSEESKPISKNAKIYQFTITEVLKSTTKFRRYYAKNVCIEEKLLLKKVLVYAPISDRLFRVGDVISGAGEVKNIPEVKNPYDFNYKNYLKKKGIEMQLFLSRSSAVIVESFENHPIRIANLIRETIGQQLRKRISNANVSALTEAMLLGRRENLDSKLKEDFVDAGAIHILAVSGLHVGILLLILNFLLKPLEFLVRGKEVKLITVLVLLWSFAFLAGLSPSVIRSVTMFSFVAVGMFFGKENGVFNAVIGSAVFLLLLNPYYIFDVGFQMSYTAVLFIIWTQPLIYNLWKPKIVLLDYFWKIITVSVAAQIGVLPLSLFYFHQFPLLFLVTNIVVIPTVGFILSYGLLVIIVSFFEKAPGFVFQVYSELVQLFNGYINWIAGFDSLVLKHINFSIDTLIFAYALIIMLFNFWERKTALSLKYFLCSCIVLQLTFIADKFQSSDELLICHENKKSLIIQNIGGEICFHAQDSILVKKVKDKYLGTTNNFKSFKWSKQQQLFSFKNQQIFVINDEIKSLLHGFHPEVICLQNSPKINLDRILLQLKPKIIIADGSNYFSMKKRWEQTCLKNGIQFFDTYKEGAFIKK